MNDINDIRVVSTVKEDGRVAFGQVIMEQQPDPKEIVLVALDPYYGLFYWKTTPRKLKLHTRPQHLGYSRYLSAFAVDDWPDHLGKGYELPKDEIDNWFAIVEANTRTKNKLIRELFV
jgi:hypothetical protein